MQWVYGIEGSCLNASLPAAGILQRIPGVGFLLLPGH